MATQVLTDAFFSWDANDLSDHVRSVAVSYEADAVEDTNMADTTHIFLGGLKNWRIEMEFSQDFAAGEVDAELQADVGAAKTVIVRPTSAAVSATNPNYTGTGMLQSYQPVGGGVGELAIARAVIVPAGALSRATS